MTQEERRTNYISEFETKYPNIEIIKYINSKSQAEYLCKRCGKHFSMTHSNLLKRQGRCPYCENFPTTPRITLAQARPDLIPWLDNPELAHKYGYTSGNKISITCPNCGARETLTVRIFSKRIYTCQNCNQDGISTPNKFLRALLREAESQLDLVETEWSPDWSGRYSYDGHIVKNGRDYLIEMNGEQHYVETGWGLEKQKERDAIKSKLAQDVGIELIVINCQNSSFTSIKNEIINSNLSNILDLSIIDWKKVEEECRKSFLIEASNLFNHGLSTSQIGKKLFLSRHTVVKLLKEASQSGLCEYLPIPIYETSKKSVEVVNIITGEVSIFHGVQNACDYVLQKTGYKIDRHTLHNYATGYYYSLFNGKHRVLLNSPYKNTYTFKYI